MARKPTSAERRQRLKSRALPLVGIAFVAFVMGVVQGCPGNPNKDAAGRYVDAWEKGDYEAMYAMLCTDAGISTPSPIVSMATASTTPAGTVSATAAGRLSRSPRPTRLQRSACGRPAPASTSRCIR